MLQFTEEGGIREISFMNQHDKDAENKTEARYS